MQRIPVESSDIVAIGYDAKARLLEIEFKEGRVYQYIDVAPDIHRLLMRADSHGQYFLASISGHYRYRRIGGEDARPAGLQTPVFVSSSRRKYRDLCAACEPLDIRIERLELPVAEIQSHDPGEIAVAKAKHAYKLADRPVLVSDMFWNTIALRGFPGAYMNYVTEWLRADDLLRLMEGKTDRTIGCTDTLVYYDGKRSKVFVQDQWGKIIDIPRGRGTAITQIVVMNGETKTIAEVEEHEGRSCIDPDNSIWSEFAKWYNLQRRLGRA